MPQGVKSPASMAAPAAPSAEEWQLAASYTPRNSKRYRHAWGQQVRSMMGTAVEGPSQGHVRFRISIAPDGTISEIKELWSTSEEASRLAWKAIQEMPRWPPSYQLDCLPEIEPFKNPFAWDGSAQPTVVRRTHRPPPPEGCPPDSTAATIEEEEHEMKRQTAQWRWGR